MNNVFAYIIFSVCFISCNNETKTDFLIPIIANNVDDTTFVSNQSFKKGDSRRYGIFPDKSISQKKLKQLTLLSSKGLPITFTKGIYQTNLLFDSISNVNFIFKDATITGVVSIINGASKIKFDGRLTILDKLFIRNSDNILFDNLIVTTDTINNIHNKQNRGVSIYAGSKNIFFNSLKIENTGGAPEDYFKFTAAALQIHGWNNNPEQVQINNLQIYNAARTALYITGSNHTFKKVQITNFGLGSTEQMFGLEDASPGEEQEFSGAWINRCNNCSIDSLEISSTLNKGMFSLRLDEGVYHQPSFINNIYFGAKAKQLPIKDDELTNILVKNEY